MSYTRETLQRRRLTLETSIEALTNRAKVPAYCAMPDVRASRRR